MADVTTALCAGKNYFRITEKFYTKHEDKKREYEKALLKYIRLI